VDNLSADGIGRLAIIGAGAMGAAFAKGVIGARIVEPSEVMLADVDESKLDKCSALGCYVTTNNSEAAGYADVILLAVKPALVSTVLSEMAVAIGSHKLLVSIAAGVKIAAIEKQVGPDTPVIRAMPNTPCRIGCGAIGFSLGTSASSRHAAIAERLFGAVGLAVEVPERLLDAVTGLSGSGPAYVYVMIEALSDAGVRVGLPRDLSLKLAAQTVMGAAKMVLVEYEHPARLKDQVTSPGGTTIAGLDALERAGFRSAIIEAVKAATNRAEELG